uniref:Uncharacterized protein n=1 Tax=Rhizophora mucronata TaxID=61149 RepID=A0A2P2PLZ4_RHIMU
MTIQITNGWYLWLHLEFKFQSKVRLNHSLSGSGDLLSYRKIFVDACMGIDEACFPNFLSIHPSDCNWKPLLDSSLSILMKDVIKLC